MTSLRPASATARRFWAGGSLLLMLTAVVLAIASAIAHFPSGLAILLLISVALWCAWSGLRKRGVARGTWIAAAAVLVGGAVAVMLAQGRVLEDLLVIVALLGALEAARRAFQPWAELGHALRPEHAVLFYNPKSGGGKAERFKLADEARRRGITPIELGRGDDLEALVRQAVRQGADALAMAGGDGSQAIVAKVAAEHDLPYACIPAGTRNHFALDLGVDRNDVVGALDAFVNGGERRVDLAEVNGRVFVNNVSLGLYADAVQRPGYRDAKIHTLLDTVPEALGDDAHPDLVWEGQGGREAGVAVLVSNNAYRLGRALGSGTRPRLDSGRLGVAVLAPSNARHNGHTRVPLGLRQWTTRHFELEAAEGGSTASKEDGSVPAGIDGEAARLESPLRFRMLPGALRVRIAPQHPGVSPSALEPASGWETVTALGDLAIHGAARRR
jgi:diacylglycerol kinase family enzyme